jgi:hypothetical protein
VKQRQLVVPSGVHLKTKDFPRALDLLGHRELDPVYCTVGLSRVVGRTHAGHLIDQALSFRVWRGLARPGGLLVAEAASAGWDLEAALVAMARTEIHLPEGPTPADRVSGAFVDGAEFVAMRWPTL